MKLFKRIGRMFSPRELDSEAEAKGRAAGADAKRPAPDTRSGGAQASPGDPAGDRREAVQSELRELVGEGGIRLQVKDPTPEAKSCQIRLNRKVSPVGSVFFESIEEAEGWPHIQALFEVPGIHSIIAKDNVLVLSRRDDADWKTILGTVPMVIAKNFRNTPEWGEEAPVGKTPKPDGEKETVWIRDGEEVANPAPRPAETGSNPTTGDIRSRVEELLAREINPGVASHGGVIRLLDVQGTRVFLEMGGGCQGCGQAAFTLKQGVETAIRSRIPEVTEVLDVTDHAAGNNPYYRA